MAEATLKMLILGEDRSAGRALKGVGDDAERTGGKLRRVGSIAAGVFAGGALVAGAASAGRALFSMGKNAMEDAAAQRRLEVALRNTTGATKAQVGEVENWISKQGVALGVTDDELRPALQRLAQSTKDITEAQKLTSLAMDVSAGSGKSLKTVSEAMAKAYAGNMGALSRLGVRIKDANGEQMSFNEVTKEMAKTFGGQAAAAADSAAGKFDRLKLIYDETKESIGAKLIPVAAALATFLLTELGPAIGDVSTWLGDNLGPALALVAEWVRTDVLPILRDLGGWVKNELIPVVRDLAEDYIAGLTDAFENVRGKLGNLQPFLDLVQAALRGVWQIVKNVLLPVLGTFYRVALPAIGTALGIVIDALGAVGRIGIWMWNNALQPVFRFLANAIAVAMDLFAKLLRTMGKVPGFGWAKKLAGDLESAADKARDVADGIKKIPTKKKVDVNISTRVSGAAADAFEAIFGFGGRTSRTAGGVTSGASRTLGGAGGGEPLYVSGEVLVTVRTDTGEIIEQKLVALKRTSGRARLAFEAVP